MIITKPLHGQLLGTNSFETAAKLECTPEAAEIDLQGHVNNAIYLTWVQEISNLHWLAAVSEEERGQWIWVVLRHEITYQEAILPTDTVEIRTWLGRASGPRIERHVDIRKASSAKTAAKALSEWCPIDVHTRRPQRANRILKLFHVENVEESETR